jgi:hypothetical protein
MARGVRILHRSNASGDTKAIGRGGTADPAKILRIREARKDAGTDTER